MATSSLKEEAFEKLTQAGAQNFEDPELADLHIDAARSFGAGATEEREGRETYARLCYKDTLSKLEMMEDIRNMNKGSFEY